MKAKIAGALVLVAVIAAAMLAGSHWSKRTEASPAQQPQTVSLTEPPEPTPGPQPETAKPAELPAPAVLPKIELAVRGQSAQPAAPGTNKLERLAQTREAFRALAAGDPALAMRSAKQITDPTERETALMTLVTEWTQGNLRPPQERARAISEYGLEAGLGIELAGNPQLALTWASELPESAGRTAVLQAAAVSMVTSDPTSAFALAEQVPEKQRAEFIAGIFSGWAQKDTDAALQYHDQLDDPADRAAALAAIRTTAPVGIGAALGIKDGYPVINSLLPGTPAQIGGQLQPGDRIVALAQGDNAFVDVHSLPLLDVVNLIRGAPGTTLQLQVLPADAPPGSMPRTIPIVRDQIRFKN